MDLIPCRGSEHHPHLD